MIASGLVDFHMHTNFSDGLLSAQQLIEYMKRRSIGTMAITDHDTVGAIVAARKIAKDNGIDLISGVEITTRWKDETVHIVALNISLQSNELLNLLEVNQAIRLERATLINDALDVLGYKGSLSYIKEKFNPKVFGRLHFAKFLCDKGYAKGIGHAFKTILNKDVIGNINKKQWPSMESVIKAIHSDNGVAILAHPLKYGLKLQILKNLVNDFSTLKGDSIEYISGKTTFKEMNLIKDISRQFGLTASIGSDFHAPSGGYKDLAKYNDWINNYNPVWATWSIH